jgi:protein MAK11
MPRCRVIPSPVTKVHHIRYVNIESPHQGKHELLAVSTEDGRILFYNTNEQLPDGKPGSSIPAAQLRGQLGGKAGGQSGRIKEFEILTAQMSQGSSDMFLVTCGSDGIVKVWILNQEKLFAFSGSRQPHPSSKAHEDVDDMLQAGKLLGEYETGNRITCLKAFVMLSAQGTATTDEPEDTVDSEDEDHTSDSDSED